IRSKQKHKHLTKKRNTKQIKKTKQIQKGGFNEQIKRYFHLLNNQINTYDAKLMLIYAYLNNINLSEADKAKIKELLIIPLFDGGIDPETHKNIFTNINRILDLGTKIDRVISMDAPTRSETLNWFVWLDIKRRTSLPPPLSPSDLLPKPIISKIKKIFNIDGVLLDKNALDNLLLPSGYSLINGQLVHNNGSNVYGSLSGQASSALVHNDKELLPLTHLWFKNWPDKSVPDLTEYCKFIKYIYVHILRFGGGSIIHCSAGVGRTGVVYITLNLLFEFGINPNIEFPLTKVPDGFTKELVLEKIMTARKYRMSLVQTIKQFSFILRCFGVREPVITESDESNIETLQNPKRLSTNTSQKFENKPKNRYSNILPYDDTIVKTLQTPHNFSGYINASFAPCALPKIPPRLDCPDFILAQCPIQNTFVDFQNMIRLYKIRRIIMVTGLIEVEGGEGGAGASGKSKCDDYLALETSKTPTPINSKFTLSQYSEMFFGTKQEYTYERYNEY
ncbi:MAG: hypothetical protein RL059_1049, partial [Bacteroidota bacterium]